MLPGEQGELTPASTLRARFENPDAALLGRLTQIYGPDQSVLEARRREVLRTLGRFLEVFDNRRCAVYRAPGRLSLNPHSDHQGAWVPYGLHLRELLGVVSPAGDGQFEVANVDPSYAPLLSFWLEEEVRRDRNAWEGEWLGYIEAPPVVQAVRQNLDTKDQETGRRSTINYIKAGALRLQHLYPEGRLPGLRIVLNGDIARGGGQSSSSAVVVTVALALAQLAGLPQPCLDRRRLAETCGEAEWYVGTRGGSGDHAAMLLGTRAGLAHLCFRAPVGIRGVRHSAFPAEYQLVLANSQTRSEKSAEERLMFNRGIFAYRFAFLALKREMPALGFPEEFIAETESLGDLHSGRVAPADLYRLLLRLPESISPAELAASFPQTFAAAARGCFGTKDLERLPKEIPLRGAAVYGLGRVDRGRIMPGLLEQGDEAAMREFGRLMSITHDGDRLFRDGRVYTESRERLSDHSLRAALADVEAGSDRPLRREPGFYGASIAELDRMVDAALRTEGVLGAGLMGAGGGGYVLILTRRGVLYTLRLQLVREYYKPCGKEEDVEAWHPTASACRLA